MARGETSKKLGNFKAIERNYCNSPLLNLICPDDELLQICHAKGGCEGDIDRNATPRHQNAPDSPLVVTGIHGPPFSAQVDFQPRAEIHGSIRSRDADIA